MKTIIVKCLVATIIFQTVGSPIFALGRLDRLESRLQRPRVSDSYEHRAEDRSERRERRATPRRERAKSHPSSQPRYDSPRQHRPRVKKENRKLRRKVHRLRKRNQHLARKYRHHRRRHHHPVSYSSPVNVHLHSDVSSPKTASQVTYYDSGYDGDSDYNYAPRVSSPPQRYHHPYTDESLALDSRLKTFHFDLSTGSDFEDNPVYSRSLSLGFRLPVPAHHSPVGLGLGYEYTHYSDAADYVLRSHRVFGELTFTKLWDGSAMTIGTRLGMHILRGQSEHQGLTFGINMAYHDLHRPFSFHLGYDGTALNTNNQF